MGIFHLNVYSLRVCAQSYVQIDWTIRERWIILYGKVHVMQVIVG